MNFLILSLPSSPANQGRVVDSCEAARYLGTSPRLVRLRVTALQTLYPQFPVWTLTGPNGVALQTVAKPQEN